MHFSPKILQRYTRSLRVFLHKSIEKNGYTPKHRENLKKLYIFEAVHFAENFTLGCDLKHLTDTLFGAAVLKLATQGKNIKTSLSGRGVFSINVKLYEILVFCLLSAAKCGSKAEFISLNRGVMVMLKNGEKDIEIKSYKNPNITKFRLLPDGDTALCFSLLKSGDESVYKKETEYLFDRYSVLNVFLD